jgi:hypothetical protein
VRDLWRREFKDTFSQSDGTGKGNGNDHGGPKPAWAQEEEDLHPAHVEAQEAHRSKKWFLERAAQRKAEEESHRQRERSDMAREDRG